MGGLETTEASQAVGGNQADNRTVTIQEDWSVRPDGTYYRYRYEGENEWHEKLTGHKGSPFVRFITLSQTEVNDMVERKLIEPPRSLSNPPQTPPKEEMI